MTAERRRRHYVGLPGSPPPGPFADNDGVAGAITGTLNKATGRLELELCFTGVDHSVRGPNMLFAIDVDAHSGTGTVDYWYGRPDCAKPDPDVPPTADGALVRMAEQDDGYDIDQDGCTAAEELHTDPSKGGQRDPYNKYDHMDMNKDGFINIPDDILIVAGLFGPSTKGVQGNVGPRMTGSVSWGHRNGDSAINIPDDISGMSAQFGHNCQ